VQVEAAKVVARTRIRSAALTDRNEAEDHSVSPIRKNHRLTLSQVLTRVKGPDRRRNHRQEERQAIPEVVIRLHHTDPIHVIQEQDGAVALIVV
jgi:hypothetical protein